MSADFDETALAALEVARSYLDSLRITSRVSMEKYFRATDRTSDVLISSDFSDDVKRSLNAVFKIANQNYLYAVGAAKARRFNLIAKLNDTALFIFAACAALFSRKK